MPNTTTNVEVVPGRQFTPDSYAVTSPAVKPIFGVVPWQTIAVFTSVTNAVFPAQGINTNAQVTIKVPILPPFPQTLAVQPSMQCIISPTVFLANASAALVVGLPYVSLVWGSGSAVTLALPGTASFYLQPGVTYRSPALVVTLTAFYAAALGANLTMPVTVQAVLYAQQP